MILGLLTIVTVFVMRFAPPGDPDLPDRITLPGGARAQAVTRGRDWFAVVTQDNRILIYGQNGQLRQTVVIRGAE